MNKSGIKFILHHCTLYYDKTCIVQYLLLCILSSSYHVRLVGYVAFYLLFIRLVYLQYVGKAHYVRVGVYSPILVYAINVMIPMFISQVFKGI